MIHQGGLGENLTDARRGKNTQLPLSDLLRQSVYSRLAGCRLVNDQFSIPPGRVSRRQRLPRF